jgi:hypothetical protein
MTAPLENWLAVWSDIGLVDSVFRLPVGPDNRSLARIPRLSSIRGTSACVSCYSGSRPS